MSTRIMRAPVRPSQGAQANAEGTTQAKPSPSTNPAPSSSSAQTTQTTQPSNTLMQAGFEAHSGQDLLLNESSKEAGGTRRPRTGMRRELEQAKKAGGSEQAAGASKEAGKKGKAKGMTQGKRALALMAGGEALLPTKGKKGGKSKTLGKVKSGSLADTKSTSRSSSKSSKTKAKGKKGIASAESKAKSAKSKTAKKTSQTATTQKASTTAQAQSKTSTGKAQTTAQAQPGQANPAMGQAKGSIQRSIGGQGMAMQPGAAGGQGKAGMAQGAGLSSSGLQGGATSGGPVGQGSAALMGEGASSTGETQRGTMMGQGLQRSLGGEATGGSTFREQMKAMQGKAALQFQAAMGKGKEAKPLSLHSLLVQEAKGGEAKEIRRGSEASPKQELRQMIQQMANAKEANLLMNMQTTVMPNDVAAVAWRIATLAQQGAIPQTHLMSLLSKTLKAPGKRKQIKRIKDLLVKKGSVPAGISTETLELIAAMIALYLAKSGNIDADDLIEELFGMPSRGIDIIVPDGGGGHHEEGREQQRHQEHQEGQRLNESES